MARQELEILLRSKADTSGFKAVQQAYAQTRTAAVGLGSTLKQQTAAFDGFTNSQLRAFAGMTSIASQSQAVWKALAVAPVAVAAGIGAVTAAVYALGQRGSEIQGVKNSFDTLTASIGGASKFLKESRSATAGLISDYNLMINANRLLGAQVPLTGEKFGELSRMAIILGRSVGKTAGESVDRLAQGLAKLEPELLDEINLKVSATEAYKREADARGVSVKSLTDYQKQMAFVNAITEQAKQRTAELGDLQLTFADRITIAKNAWSNFYDNLSLGVALAPGLARGMDLISAAALNAFGGDQERAIRTIVGWVDKFAIGTMKAAEIVVTSAKVSMQAWSGFQVLFAGVAQAITAGLATIVAAQGKVFEFLAIANPVLSGFYTKAAEGAKSVAKELDLTSKAWGLAGKMAQESGYATFKSLTAVEESIAAMRKEMEAASAKGVTATAVQKALAGATTDTGKASGLSAKELAKLRKEHEAFLKVIDRQSDALGISNQEVKWAAVMWKQWHAVLMPIGMATLPKIVSDTYELAAGLKGVGVQMQFASSKSHDMGKAVDDALDEAEEKARKLKDALDEIGEGNARTIIGTFDAISRSIGGSFDRIASGWIGMFDQMISASKKNGGKLWEFLSGKGGTKAAGNLSAGVQGFSTGYDLASMSGTTSMWKGAALGAGGGAVAGAPYAGATGGWSIAIGAGIGAIGGALAARKNKKEQENALKDIQQDLLKTYGSMENLRKVAQGLGVDIDKAFSSKKPKDALKVIQEFEAASQAAQKRIEGISTATEGLTIRSAAAFGGNLTELLDARIELQKGIAELQQQIAEADRGGDRSGAERLRLELVKAQAELDKVQGKLVTIGATGEAEFNRLATYAAATFAAQVKESGNVVEALSAIEPTLEQLKKAQEAFGFSGSETINRLLGFRDVANANKDVFQSLSGLTQMMKGFGDAGLITRDLFQTFAQDAGAQFNTLVDRGVDANQALAMMAPTLQELYEGQSKYGLITDETTQKLIDQAKEQGLVGDHMKSTNEQILDATLGVKDAIKELAATLRGEVPAAAETAANGITRAFDGVHVRIPVHYETEGDEPGMHNWGPNYIPGYNPGGGGEYPGYATGGVIPFTPGGRLIRVAERGAERVTPADQSQAAPIVNLSFDLRGATAKDAEAITGAIKDDALPHILRAISGNKDGARTKFRQALGVN